MKPRRAFWLVTAAAVLGSALTLSLGAWQLRRAAVKEALAAAIQERNALEVLDGRAFSAPVNIANLVHRRFAVQGNWLPAQTVFLDNRQMDGLTGYFVVTPLQLGPQGPLVVVQRGWVQRDFTRRTRLPEVPTPSGTVTVSGRLALPPGKLYEPARLSGGGDVEPGPIRQNLDLAALAAQTGLPVLEASLLQTGDAPDGLRRHWPVPNTGVEKHYGYAAQWIALCALIVGLYLWYQVLAPYVRSRSTRPSA